MERNREKYRSNIAKNNRNNRRSYHGNSNRVLMVKTIACLIGITALLLISSTYRNHIVKEGKAPYVTVQEVLPQLQAFSEVCGNSAYTDMTTNDSFFLQEYVTLADVKEILQYFGDIDDNLLIDYKGDSWYIGLKDWNTLLTQLVQRYGSDRICLTELEIIGGKQNVLDEQGKEPADGQVLTDKGVMDAVYWNTDAYMYSNTMAVCYGAKILSVMEYAKEPAMLRNVYVADVTAEGAHFFKNHYHMRYQQKKGKVSNTDNVEIQQEKEQSAKTVTLKNTDTVTSGMLVNLRFDKGVITIEEKNVEYIHGKLLQVSDEGIEIEGYGVFEPDEEMEVYRLYGELATLDEAHLRIGYSFTDFVLEDGNVVACLMLKEEDMDYIRVLLNNSNYAGRYHDSFIASCDQDYEIIYYENGVEVKREEKTKGDSFSIEAEDLDAGVDRVKLLPKVLSAKTAVDSIERSQGTPEYLGTLEIIATEEGLVLINEVLLEDYLCKVVPSEMPSSYPKEALMAQAVCARTYAYGKMIKSGIPDFGAHVDDSTGFQVYNNIREQDSTTEAVKATHNRIALYQGEPIGAYYYSTSSGAGTDANVWHGTGGTPGYLTARVIGEAYGHELTEGDEGDTQSGREEGVENEESEGNVGNETESKGSVVRAADLALEERFREWILNTDDTHYESEEGWYRWTYVVEKIDIEYMEEVLQSRYESNPNLILTQTESGEFESKPVTTLGKIEDIAVTKRLSGGVADELMITGSEATIKVLSELNIRYVLADGITKALRQSGDEAGSSAMLPSAFIVVDSLKEDDVVTGYQITGGGFGHGVGMSQNGAKNMALLGKTCDEILTFFYPGIEIKTLQFEDGRAME